MKRLAFLLGVAACAHTPTLPLRPDPTPPVGSTTEIMVARDGTQLLARTWAAVGEPRGVVVIMHGLKDHSARYAGLATRLSAGGYAVYAFDLRGHGHSAGKRVSPDHWLDYVDDLDRFLTSVEAKEPGRKIFVFGHSMGGAIAALTAERHRPAIAGLMLSGPALIADAPPVLIAATRMAGVLSPNVPALKLPNADFSSDPAVVRAIADDPMVSQPPGPAGTAAGLIEGIRAVWMEIDHLTMPLLAMHGTADKLTAPAGSRALIRAAPATDKTLRIYDGLYHDLLHEPDGKGKRVEDDLVAWLDAHTGGAAVTPPPIDDRPLPGDPRGWSQAVDQTAGIASADGHLKFSGEFSLNLARPRPIGWHGALTGRIAGDFRALALRPLGIAARTGASVFGISGGIALVTGTHFAYSGGAWLEQPLGPAHVGVLAEWSRLVKDSAGAGPIGSDLLWTSLALRFGGDRTYWPHARAGIGPVLIGGIGWLGDARVYSVTAGLQVYGVD